ncbi:glycosyltransferase [Zoogloea sp.]|uniref:glycosyltransferase n=1 Tax=Zoogloea sp. TaxID=49181 RepID=UPI0035B0AB70
MSSSVENKRVVMVSMHRFPFGDAASNRMWAMARSIALGGSDVYVVGNGVLDQGLTKDGNWVSSQGILFKTVRSNKDSFFSRVVRRLFHVMYFHSALSGVMGKHVSCVVTTHAGLSLGLLFACKFVWRKPLIVDCTEWHEASQFSRGRFSADYLLAKYKFDFLCPKADAVICITNLLKQRFDKVGVRTLVVPPQVSSEDFVPHGRALDDGVLELFYAGTLAGKDDLKSFFAGLCLLTDQELSRVRFTIAGPSPKEIGSLIDSIGLESDRLRARLRLLGRVSRSQVLSELSSKHFTVLLRPISRYSMAGFPSKIPESLAAGTPVLVNLTSDLDIYLKDGDSAIIVRDLSPESVAIALRRALALNPVDKDRMSLASTHLAATMFDYTVWGEEITSFIESVA